MLWIKADFGSGDIQTAVREAKELSVKNGVGVSLSFNGVEIPVAPHSEEKDLLAFYHLAISRPTSVQRTAEKRCWCGLLIKDDGVCVNGHPQPPLAVDVLPRHVCSREELIPFGSGYICVTCSKTHATKA